MRLVLNIFSSYVFLVIRLDSKNVLYRFSFNSKPIELWAECRIRISCMANYSLQAWLRRRNRRCVCFLEENEILGLWVACEKISHSYKHKAKSNQIHPKSQPANGIQFNFNWLESITIEDWLRTHSAAFLAASSASGPNGPSLKVLESIC